MGNTNLDGRFAEEYEEDVRKRSTKRYMAKELKNDLKVTQTALVRALRVSVTHY